MNINGFLNHQTKTVSMAAGMLAVSSLISKLLGLARDWLLAEYFGAGAQLDIYFTAFKIPDFVYNIFVLGGVLVAFLPLFSEYFSKDEKEAWRFSSNLLNVFLLLLIFVSLILFSITPFLVRYIAPGFDHEQLQKTIILTRILFLSPIFFGLSSIFSGILQYFNRFLIYSLCPVLYNLGIIFGILFLSNKWGIVGVGFGVVIGAFLHFFVQIPSALNCGFSYKAIVNFKDPKIKKAFVLMIPRILGIAATQINLVVINAIASTLSEGSISVFNFANNIQHFPIGIIGTSFALASFPLLSKKWAEKEKQGFINEFSFVFRQILYLILPVSVLLFVLRNLIVEVFLKHGQFSLMSAQLTSASLGLFCFGIFASSLIPLLFRAFFSLKDTKTPTLIAVLSMIINIFLSFFLIQNLSFSGSGWQNSFQEFLKNMFSLQGILDISVLGLALAFSVSAIFQFVLLFVFFKKKMLGLNLKQILSSFLKILISVVLMVIVIHSFSLFFDSFFSTQTLIGMVVKILAISLVGIFVYLFSTLFLRSPEFKTVLKIF